MLYTHYWGHFSLGDREGGLSLLCARLRGELKRLKIAWVLVWAPCVLRSTLHCHPPKNIVWAFGSNLPGSLAA